VANLGERIGTGTQLRRGLAVALQATVGVLPVLLVSRRLLMTGRVLHRLGGERVHRGWLEFPSDGVRAALAAVNANTSLAQPNSDMHAHATGCTLET